MKKLKKKKVKEVSKIEKKVKKVKKEIREEKQKNPAVIDNRMLKVIPQKVEDLPKKQKKVKKPKPSNEVMESKSDYLAIHKVNGEWLVDYETTHSLRPEIYVNSKSDLPSTPIRYLSDEDYLSGEWTSIIHYEFAEQNIKFALFECMFFHHYKQKKPVGIYLLGKTQAKICMKLGNSKPKEPFTANLPK